MAELNDPLVNPSFCSAPQAFAEMGNQGSRSPSTGGCPGSLIGQRRFERCPGRAECVSVIVMSTGGPVVSTAASNTGARITDRVPKVPRPGDLPGAGHLVPGSVTLQLRNELSGEPNDLAGRRCQLGVPRAAAAPRGEQEWDGDGDRDQGGAQQPPRPGGRLGRWRRGLRGHYRRGRRLRGGGDGHRFDRRRDRGGRRRRRFPDLPVCVTSAETQRIEDRNARAAPGPYRVRSKRHGFRTHRKPGMALDDGHCRSAGHFEPNERSRGWLVKFDRTAPII